MKQKTCIIIVGPTAVGKTAIAIELARHFQTEIISADSRQCYKELNSGVAKPSTEQLQEIRHYFINSHSVTDQVTAKMFESIATEAINKIFLDNDIAIMVGGTGLYIKAFCEGLNEIPEIKPEIRQFVIDIYDKQALEGLKKILAKEDPLYITKGEIQNPRRVMRALEVKLSTGLSIIEFQSGTKKILPFKIIKAGIQLPKDILYDNIGKRVDWMIENGLQQEAESLFKFKSYNGLNTIGYKEFFEYIEHKKSLQNAMSDIKLNTRHYAKRQMTWFKKEADIQWYHPDTIIPAITQNLAE